MRRLPVPLVLPAMQFSIFTPIVFTIGVVTLAACHTAVQRRATENAAIQSEAAQEVRRICALPASDRQAQIQRIRTESGVVMTCPNR